MEVNGIHINILRRRPDNRIPSISLKKKLLTFDQLETNAFAHLMALSVWDRIDRGVDSWTIQNFHSYHRINDVSASQQSPPDICDDADMETVTIRRSWRWIPKTSSSWEEWNLDFETCADLECFNELSSVYVSPLARARRWRTRITLRWVKWWIFVTWGASFWRGLSLSSWTLHGVPLKQIWGKLLGTAINSSIAFVA